MMSEAQLLAEITRLCDQLGLLWHHDLDSRRSQGTPGFPDLVIAGPHAVIFRELKNDGGETSAEQDRWAWTLTGTVSPARYNQPVQFWKIWRPGDWLSSGIKRELAAIAQQHS